MRQFALPLSDGWAGTRERIIVGAANGAVLEALARPADWPFRAAVLTGPPRSGKSLLAAWFAETGLGEAIDDADRADETALFHRWNGAQESGRPLLFVATVPPGDDGWRVRLPDLGSRLAAAMALAIGAPDEAMLAQLIALHAEQRGLPLDVEAAADYLVPRCERSHGGIERLVAAIDRISLERKAPPTLAVWRQALDELSGAGPADQRQPRLL